MELRHIRYFLAVAEARNFTRAAAKIGIGQPPLSQQIRDLEQEVGTALFHRIPQGAELTEAGQAFLDAVASMPGQVERAVLSARRAGRGEVGSLRIGFTGSAPFNPVVTGAIRAFRRAFPQVELSLEEGNTNHLVEALVEGRLDVALVRPPAADAALQVRPLFEEPLVAVLPASHERAADDPIALASLADTPLLLTPRGVGSSFHDAVLSACRDAGFEPLLGQAAPQISSVINLVAAEFGFALVPASMRQLQVAGVAYRALAGVPPVVRLALASRRGETSPVIRNFVAIAGR